jgi:hypothetical protein
VSTHIRSARGLLCMAVALLLTLPAAAIAIHPAAAVYRGNAEMGKRSATTTFRVVHSHVVDFQLAGLDVQDMLIRADRFAGCNTREAAHPCVKGRFVANDRAQGTVAFGKHGSWHFSARAIGMHR